MTTDFQDTQSSQLALMLAGTPVYFTRSARPGSGGMLVICWLLVRRRYPQTTLFMRLWLAVLWTALFAVAYGIHSLGHIFSARWVRAPMDALMMETLQWRNVYSNNAVTAQQHLGRAAGGPLANLVVVALGWLLRPLLPNGVFRRDLLEMFVCFNALLGGLSMLPAPIYDGGVLLKWALLPWANGDEETAEIVVREAGFALGFLLGVVGVTLLLARRTLGGLLGVAAGFLSLLGVLRRDV